MQEHVLSQKCYHHNQETIAFDLDPLIKMKDRYFCKQCLIELSKNFQQRINKYLAQQIFIEMTNKYYENKKDQITSQIESLLKAQNQIREFQEFFNNKISESMKLLKLKISEAENELQNLTEPSSQGMQTEQDLINLSNYVNFGLTLNQMNHKKYEFIDQIQQQLDELKLGEHLWIISNTLESIFTQSLIKEQIEFIPSKEQQEILNKTLFQDKQNQTNLRYLCDKHKQEFNMIYLEPGPNKQRIYCQSCILENDLNKSNLKTILMVNSLWQTHLQNNNKFQTLRQNHYNQINEEIAQYQKLHQQSFKKINELRKNQNKRILKDGDDSEFSKINKQLYKMDLNEIEKVAQILSLKDPLQQFQQDDQQYRDKIVEELNSQRQKLLKISEKVCNNYCLKDYMEQLNNNGVETLFLNQVFPDFLKQYSKCLNQYKLVINYIKSKLDSYQIQNLNQEQNTHRENQYNKFKKIFEQIQQIQKNELKTIYQAIQYQAGQNSELTTNKIIYDSKILQNSYFIYGKNLKFQDKEKHQKIKLSANYKIATIKHRNTKSAICLCDQLIPLSGSFQVEFKINLLCQIRIGICDFLKAVEKDYCFDDQNQIGHGFYVLDNHGYIYPHHDVSKNVQKLGFEFEKDDTINVEVDQLKKQIIWRNKAKGLGHAVEFKSSENLYFCCVLFSSDIKITEVEII